MFEQSIVPTGRSRPWTLVVAFIGELVAIGILILIPLIYIQALPVPQTLSSVLLAPPPPPPPPPPPAPAVTRAPKVVVRKFDANALTAPRAIPKQIPIINDAPAPPEVAVAGGVPGGIPGGTPGGVLGGVLNSVPTAAPPPPPPPAAATAPATPSQIQVGGQVQKAKLIHEILPPYPPLARGARIQGTVVLKATIAKDGTVQDLSVIRGHPLLVPAAIAAVKQWVYQPTILNGNPVEVLTTIDVNFTLRS